MEDLGGQGYYHALSAMKLIIVEFKLYTVKLSYHKCFIHYSM